MTVTHVGPELGILLPATETGVESPLDARRVAERVGALLGEIGQASDARVVERSEDLVSLLMQLYGAGIRRMMEIADEAGLLAGDLLERYVHDELVSSLLVIHDLHPVDLDGRVRAALESVRPYLGSHGGDVEILGIEGDVVRLRMEGSCSTCPSSTVTLSYAIEKAILDAAPEISRIEAEDVQAEDHGPLIQLEPRRGASGPSAPVPAAIPMISEWVVLDQAARPGQTGLKAVDIGGLSVLICRSANDLYAYRDRCPNCRSRLAAGRLLDASLTCATCGHAFDVRLAGRSIGGGELHLEPLPLLTDGGSIRIAVPMPVVAVAFEGTVTSAAIATA